MFPVEKNVDFLNQNVVSDEYCKHFLS